MTVHVNESKQLQPESSSSPLIAVSPPVPDDIPPSHDSGETADTTRLVLSPASRADNDGPLTPPFSTTNASTDIESRRSSDALLASLRRLATLRMRLLGYRVSAKEESRLIRNLHGQLITELYRLYNLVPAIRQPKDSPVENTSKESAEWDECLIEIEDCIEQSEEAGRRFEQKQNAIDELEEQLQSQEDGIYQSYGQNRLSPTLEFEDEVAHQDTMDSELDLPEEIERFLSLSKIPPEVANSPLVLPDEDGSMPFSSTPQSPQQQPFEFEDGDYVNVGDEIADGDFVKLFGPVSDDFSQFTGKDVDVSRLIEKAREAALVLEPGFSENDVDRFFRWLAYGRPFSDRLAAPQDEPPLPRSVLSLFRTWIWHSLALLSAGLQIPTDLPPRNLNLKEINFARIRAIVAQNWLWDPHVRITRSKPSRHEEDLANEPDGEQTVVDKPSPSLSVPLRPSQSSVVVQTNADTGTADQAYSRQDTFRPVPMSEQSGSHVGRSDFVEGQSRSNLPNRRVNSW